MPAAVRRYIHDLETRTDPAGELEERARLQQLVEQLTSFGLVYIPVAVYPATREEKVSFKQLRKATSPHCRLAMAERAAVRKLIRRWRNHPETCAVSLGVLHSTRAAGAANQ